MIISVQFRFDRLQFSNPTGLLSSKNYRFFSPKPTVPAQHLLPVGQRTIDADVLPAGDDHEPETQNCHQSLVAYHTGRHLLLGLCDLRFESGWNARPRSANQSRVSLSLFGLLDRMPHSMCHSICHSIPLKRQ